MTTALGPIDQSLRSRANLVVPGSMYGHMRAGGLPAGYPHLPNTISKAADAMAADDVLRSVLGASFCDYWVNTRRWEWLMFHTTGGDPMATSVTQWELDRFFEIV